MKKTIKATIKKLIPNAVILRALEKYGHNSLALTFDDGPHPDLTPRVLDILEEYKVRAFFFVVGKFLEKYPNLLIDIRQRGHIIGNHTYEHPEKNYSSYFAYKMDVKKCQDKIYQITGEKALYFRPPRGVVSLKSLWVAKTFKLKTVLWSCEGGEWDVNRTDDATTIANRLLTSLKPNDIVLLHDNNPKILNILEIILPSLKQNDIDLYNAINHLPD
jgi:peptidoglycan/xylan/chitin deacetylase (PgdA/CDA1 family)